MITELPQKRPVEVVVISDVHLGTYGCHSTELLDYMKSISPETVVLNGDIIDIWQFKKRYWPKDHMRVIKQIIQWVTEGVTIYYVTGNHDEMLRRFVNFHMHSFKIVNKVVLELDGKKAWCFHGDVFDVTMQHSKWLVKLGSIGYDVLILLNRFVNSISRLLGRGRISLSKKIKDSVKSAVKFINNFEHTAAEIAIENEFDYVVCGHIHKPEMKKIEKNDRSVMYLNSGDWVENLTALEYSAKQWSIYKYDSTHFRNKINVGTEMDLIDKSSKEIFNELLSDFNIMGNE